MLGRELWAQGEGFVENPGIRIGDEQAGRVASAVPFDDAARWLGCVLGVADSAKSRTVEQGAIVEVEDEYGCVGRRIVELGERGKPPRGELEFRESAHDADPLASRSP